ncbi:hypothetical protein [Alkaliphilus peptidifermentans]|uniref:Uncharacterized protein n=1 Tax=Alkaliphilus peptidifermentans DSM 18978 TaxID=1120976 RepID=A0A1G5CNL2_9FIRM|nr:hypothetical protein [Alkaliphilus peptidifermentans]SCY04043.1 hypothetical protein SAMN03080606_00720 [Alkaliphilus peptidifermentans DSM 18978]
MESVCPVCNCLASYIVKCHSCGNVMKDYGVIQDYFDDYSPYLDRDITERLDGATRNECMHVFFCEICNWDSRIPINRIMM